MRTISKLNETNQCLVDRVEGLKRDNSFVKLNAEKQASRAEDLQAQLKSAEKKHEDLKAQLRFAEKKHSVCLIDSSKRLEEEFNAKHMESQQFYKYFSCS